MDTSHTLTAASGESTGGLFNTATYCGSVSPSTQPWVWGDDAPSGTARAVRGHRAQGLARSPLPSRPLLLPKSQARCGNRLEPRSSLACARHAVTRACGTIPPPLGVVGWRACHAPDAAYSPRQPRKSFHSGAFFPSPMSGSSWRAWCAMWTARSGRAVCSKKLYDLDCKARRLIVGTR